MSDYKAPVKAADDFPAIAQRLKEIQRQEDEARREAARKQSAASFELYVLGPA